MPARCPNRLDHLLCRAGRNDLVGGPLEGPNRGVLEFQRQGRVASAGNRYERRPAFRICRTQAPGAVAPHRPAREDAAVRIDGKLFFNRIENRQGPLAVRTRRRPGGQNASLRVFALRKDDEERKCRGPFLHVRTQTDGRLQDAVASPLAGPVEVEDHGPFFVGRVVLRNEQDVFMLAGRVVENARNKAAGRVSTARAVCACPNKTEDWLAAHHPTTATAMSNPRRRQACFRRSIESVLSTKKAVGVNLGSVRLVGPLSQHCEDERPSPAYLPHVM